jgi:hypothetical protein
MAALEPAAHDRRRQRATVIRHPLRVQIENPLRRRSFDADRAKATNRETQHQRHSDRTHRQPSKRFVIEHFAQPAR